VLSLLRHAGDSGVTNAVFLDWRIPRFSARIRELREGGFVIETEAEHSSRVRYTLMSEPDVERAGSSPGLPAGTRGAPVAGLLGTGVEGDGGEGSPDAGDASSGRHPSSVGAGHPVVALSSERLFDMEPERVGHYDREAA
jgi:hypothetical protein